VTVQFFCILKVVSSLFVPNCIRTSLICKRYDKNILVFFDSAIHLQNANANFHKVL